MFSSDTSLKCGRKRSIKRTTDQVLVNGINADWYLMVGIGMVSGRTSFAAAGASKQKSVEIIRGTDNDAYIDYCKNNSHQIITFSTTNI